MPARPVDSVRRTGRRLRAAARDIAHPREALDSLREIRALRSEHPGLTSDLSPLERPSSRRVLIVSLSDDPEQVRLEALLAKGLQLRGGRVVVQAFRSSRAGVRLWRAFGIRNLVFYEDVAPAGGSLAAARELTRGVATVQSWKELEYRGARVGRQALSTLVRARHDPLVDLDAPATRNDLTRLVAVGIDGVHTAETVIERTQPDLLLMIERGYAGLGAISDVAINRGLPVVQFGSAHRDDAFFLKRYTVGNRDLQQRSLDERTWRRLGDEPWTDEKEKQLRAELAEREQGKWFMARRLRHSARRRSPDELREVLRLDERKVAVLFSHVLWDASMFYGRDLYPDQGTWFVETIRLAAADERVQWLVKLHPAVFWKLRADGVTGQAAELTMIRERVGGLPDHVHLLLPDADVDNADLFQIIDAGVTIRGTVGLELPQLGVPVITAGTSDYAGRGFTVDAESIEEYERNVRGIADLPRLAPAQVELAKRYAYGVFCVRPWRFTSFALDYLPPERGRDLLHRLRYEVRTERDLREAQDLEAFARWVLESDDADFTASFASADPPASVAAAR
jgi:hypothetical protein